MALTSALKRVVRRTFQEAVNEAVAIAREHQRPSGFDPGDARPAKLSARVYLQEALTHAQADDGRVRELRAHIAGLSLATDFPHVARFIGGAMEVVRATRYDKGCALTPPSGNWHTLLGTAPQGVAALLTDCMMLKCTPAELLALVVLVATEEVPEAFGLIDISPAEYERRRAAAAEHSTALERELRRLWTEADVEFRLLDESAGMGKLVWRLAPEISVYPLDGESTGPQGLVRALAAR